MPFFPGADGLRLAYREVGAGRPVILLHGLVGDGTMWLRHGQADAIAAHGYRVILPDLRGHGDSAKPHDAAAYPPDVLTDDGLALVAHLGLDDYDLGGYSLGARIVVRMLVRGATPGRAVVAGQGMREVLGIGGGAGARLRRAIEERAEGWLASSGEDPVALLHVLDSIVATPAGAVRRIEVPTLVVVGTDDERAASADELVAVLPRGKLVVIPGNHSTAVAAPELTTAIVDFLTDR
jgi:pimeloyl-ACP methyl ester carboxylesterase